MIKIPILDKKSICHALLTSPSDPEIILPIKGVIEDVFFDEDMPLYSIRIIKFYDNIHFLKDNFFDKPFHTNYKGKSKPIVVPKTIKSVAELDTWFGENSKYRFIIESNLVVRNKNEMMELFNKIQEYIICKNLRAVRTIILRATYDGPLKLNSTAEWENRLERGFSDLFPTVKDAKSFISSI